MTFACVADVALQQVLGLSGPFSFSLRLFGTWTRGGGDTSELALAAAVSSYEGGFNFGDLYDFSGNFNFAGEALLQGPLGSGVHLLLSRLELNTRLELSFCGNGSGGGAEASSCLAFASTLALKLSGQDFTLFSLSSAGDLDELLCPVLGLCDVPLWDELGIVRAREHPE